MTSNPIQAASDPLLSKSIVESVNRTTGEARGLPNEAYNSESFFRNERDHLFAKTWACIGFASNIPAKGYAQPINFMSLPLLCLRDKQGEIRVFHNVCSHRGRMLVAEPCEVQGMLRCPYHSWTYTLRGELRGTPHFGGCGVHSVEGFDRSEHGLKAIRSVVWMDMIFINLSGGAPDFKEHIAPLTARWQSFYGERGLEQIRRVNQGGALQMTLKTNWKLAVENYCEAYHLPWVHPALNSYSRLEDHYNIMVEDRFAGQGSLAYNLADIAGTSLPCFPEWPEGKMRQAEYISLYPNVLLGIQADHAFAMMVEPVAFNQTVEHLQLFFVGDEANDDQYAAARTATLESWRVVFSEDIAAVEGMQMGRESPGFSGGLFSPEMDQPTHHFHRWVANTLTRGM